MSLCTKLTGEDLSRRLNKVNQQV